MLQNDSRSSKSDHFRFQNDVPELQNRPLNHLNTQKSTPKWNQNPSFIFYSKYSEYIYPNTFVLDTFHCCDLKQLQSFNNISTRQHNSNLTPHTSDITRPTGHVALHTLHFTLCTLHLTLPSPHSTRPGGLREAIKLSTRSQGQLRGDCPT